MTQPIEEITGRSGGNNVKQTLEKWGYTPGKGFASTSSQANTGNNTTRENSNDKLNSAAMDSKDAGSVGGSMNANTITQAQSSNTGNSNDNSSGSMKHRASDNAKWNKINNSKSDFEPAISLFGDTDKKLQKLQQGYQRLGVNISSETMSKMDADVITEKSLQAPGQLNKTTLKQALEHAPGHLEAYSDSSDFN
jgi:hypothetical protein